MFFLIERRKGFTIVELLVVIAIIAVLAAILFPVFARAKQSGLRATALTQAKQIGTALTMYLNENNDRYLPSTNYGLADSDPAKMWQNDLIGLVKDKKIFVAPGSDGEFAETWDDRGQMSIGYSSATALDKQQGCSDDKSDTTNCIAFQSVAEFDKTENTSAVGLFAVTPNGPTANNYRGYEFSPFNGTEIPGKPELSPPLVSDRDLVKEMSNLPADLIKPIYCRYMSTGKDEGFTPVIFADGHAKDYDAKSINDGGTGIIWRFR
ncbi:MAG: prepilin-type N-terminal cleavage/methylation domain-containing protein [Fimbriimonas sp.]|nr:prepilin-type N-terminal cleavage/methylation domain-containing protein [Fimbriimonas sp.]